MSLSPAAQMVHGERIEVLPQARRREQLTKRNDETKRRNETKHRGGRTVWAKPNVVGTGAVRSTTFLRVFREYLSDPDSADFP